jgi:hypothetical protein
MRRSPLSSGINLVSDLDYSYDSEVTPEWTVLTTETGLLRWNTLSKSTIARLPFWPLAERGVV